jgi:Flp pilus assembly protein TadD
MTKNGTTPVPLYHNVPGLVGHPSCRRELACSEAGSTRRWTGRLLGIVSVAIVTVLAGCAQGPVTGPTITDATREQLARALDASGDHESAAEVLRGRQSQQAPAHATDPIGQAALLIANGQVDQGMAEARGALAARGDDPVFALQVAHLAIKAGQLSEAGDIYQAILPRHPDNVDAWNGKGVVFAQQGNLSGAADAFGQALALRPDDPTSRYNLALVMLLSGETEVAISMLDALNRSNPSSQVSATLAMARSREQISAASAAPAAPAGGAPTDPPP